LEHRCPCPVDIDVSAALFKYWMTYETDPLGSKMPQRHNTNEAAGHACGFQDRGYETEIFIGAPPLSRFGE
jgi:hypothetical protein